MLMKMERYVGVMPKINLHSRAIGIPAGDDLDLP